MTHGNPYGSRFSEAQTKLEAMKRQLETAKVEATV